MLIPRMKKIIIRIASILSSILSASNDKVNKAFRNRAYDIGILDKVFIAVPALAKEARQFARRQRIKVFEAAGL